MKTYKAYLINHPMTREAELVELLEMQRPRMTKRDFDNIIAGLFFWACQTCTYEDMEAIIKCEDKKLHAIQCKTRMDGSTVTAYLSIDGQPYRAMEVAA